ncbi:MAG TPA: hypothetical protein VMB25_24075 [Bryobacteraceae bacterium]|nr:hypothetical protein [Bryobacteraceae bacterium]
MKPIVPPSIYRTLETHMGRRTATRWLAQEGVLDLALKVAERFDYTVQTGPFQGMRYTRSAVLSRHATPTLIGQYERQIYPALMEMAKRVDLVIDIGHAEGYYAVGLARLGKRVIAFDADPHERRICEEMAHANHVAGRISIRRWCDSDSLLDLSRGQRTLILSDIDGGELDLFTPAVIEGLSHCDLLVELHGGTREENAPFVRRFRAAYQVELIEQPAEPAGITAISFLGSNARRMATEYRPFQQWMIARTKSGVRMEWEPELDAVVESGVLQ